jgi:Leucine-rich repeat (LRR) protein
MLSLRELNGAQVIHTRASIVSLEGLQFAKNLRSLSPAFNAITDLSPISHLTRLTDLNCAGNAIADLRPLRKLVNLKTLSLGGNRISNIRPLRGLHKLSELELPGNFLVNINALAQNTGFGPGDVVEISDNYLDLSRASRARAIVGALRSRGVTVGDSLQRAPPKASLFDLSDGAEVQLQNGSATRLDFGVVKPWHSISRTFRLTNAGATASETLRLGSLKSWISLPPLALPRGYSLAPDLSQAALEAGTSITFTIEFVGPTPGTYSGSIKLYTNDPAADPFRIPVIAVVEQ